jgi:hypothetical protein
MRLQILDGGRGANLSSRFPNREFYLLLASFFLLNFHYFWVSGAFF